MVIRKRKIIIDGKEIEVPIFQTKIEPGANVNMDTLNELSREEDLEKEIHKSLSKIRKIKRRYKSIEKNTNYFYAVGKLLQFVEKRKYFKKHKGEIWRRMAHDLAPKLFSFDTRKPPTESKRYPEFMYLLSKVPKKLLINASWDQWYEIMKFKDIYNNQKLLQKALKECKDGKSGPSLREQIRIIKGSST